MYSQPGYESLLLYSDQMNIAGHIAVAQAFSGSRGGSSDDHALVLLGSALPDICNIAQVRLQNRSTSEHVQYGIELHHQTDDAFHAHRWFRDLMAETMDKLTQHGVRRGPARACAHIGPELLLDGALTAQRALMKICEEAFASISNSMPLLTPMVADADQEAWARTLTRLHDAKRPLDYRDPDTVADRMERILRNRPRLSLDKSEVEPVTKALRAMLPTIETDANWLIADLQQVVAGDTAGKLPHADA